MGPRSRHAGRRSGPSVGPERASLTPRFRSSWRPEGRRLAANAGIQSCPARRRNFRTEKVHHKVHYGVTKNTKGHHPPCQHREKTLNEGGERRNFMLGKTCTPRNPSRSRRVLRDPVVNFV